MAQIRSGAAMSLEQSQRLAQVIRQRAGVEAPGGKEILEAVVARRVEELGFDDCEQYLTFITAGPFTQSEFQELYARLGVTSIWAFLHNEPQLTVFEKTVLPALLKTNESTRRLRIWCPGCGTGEDVYTLAMILQRALGSRFADWRIQILGTDFSEKAVLAAQNGVFNERSLKNLNASDKNRFFKRTDGGWTVDASLRHSVSFDVHAITDRLAAKRYGLWDAVVCRGLLRAMDADHRQRALEVFADQLPLNGWLITGQGQCLEGSESFFAPVDVAQGCYRRQAHPPAPVPAAGFPPDHNPPRLRLA